MIYGYIRVSTDKQTVENQRFEISCFCDKQNINIDSWIEETISGSKEPEKRKLGKLLARMTKGDILICAELSRLGRNLLMIMGILNQCMKREVQVWTIKDNYRLGADKGVYKMILCTDDKKFGGRGLVRRKTVKTAKKQAHGKDNSILLTLPRFTGIYLVKTN